MSRRCFHVVWLTALAGLLGACSLTGKGLDPGPAGAVRIGYVRSPSTPSPEDVDDPNKLPGDFPVDLSALFVNAVPGAAADGRKAADADEGTLICEHRTSRVVREARPDTKCGADEVAARWSTLEQARKTFYARCGSPQACTQARDRVQDRLVWASENACADYLVFVRRSFTRTNLNLGSATTFFGALGSVLRSADATRVFSGSAALTSGLRAEYNDVYFSSQAFELVSRAIRSVRERGLKRIQDYRTTHDIGTYTLEAAVGDAMRYHAACNVMAGLEEAADAITRDRDPGLKRLNELLQDSGAVASVSLGAATVDTAGLPLATTSCRALAAEKDRADAEVARLDVEVKRLGDAAPPDASRLAAARTALASLKTAQGSVAAAVAAVAPCKAPAAGGTPPAETAEKAMYEAIRIFSSAPLAEKAARRLEVEAAKAKVMAIKLDVDRETGRVRQSVEAMRTQVTRLVAATP